MLMCIVNVPNDFTRLLDLRKFYGLDFFIEMEIHSILDGSTEGAGIKGMGKNTHKWQ